MDRLKKELQKLRRENSRLKKQLNRIDDEEFKDDSKEDDAEPAKERTDKKNNKHQPGEIVEARSPGCTKCTRETKTVEFGQYKYLCCEYCNHRQKLK